MKITKFAICALIMAFVVGCSSNKNNDTSGSTDGNSGYDSNAGVGVGTGDTSGFNGMSAEEVAALRAITTFYFNYDSSDLQPDSMRALDVHAHDLMQNGKHVVLQGHTDERGTREYNMALGERRGNAVKRYLTMQGVSPSQLEVVSYGKERPAVSGHDEAAWAKNRRVELIFQ
ncbi:peptidoglycan-associated lipoprotein Pal [Entomomonas sp. E2T0]|uniref:peptidoglycan-associated lipoprotein Pal n=1 Tax=Entomomonas sp. E2T0 TaxID=2930213 RepID=UPI00222841B1|nr:peptidoglycan-associated lipoprotein Pal [Entomomonas sp. E2T0]UYZ84234.1 peptidoglycan-associated lipoprotein Pal [Entomomonas sp. E2T0]